MSCNEITSKMMYCDVVAFYVVFYFLLDQGVLIQCSYTTAKWECLPADLDNTDKSEGLMEANVNMMQVLVALNQGMIFPPQRGVRQEAELGKHVHVCVCTQF